MPFSVPPARRGFAAPTRTSCTTALPSYERQIRLARMVSKRTPETAQRGDARWTKSAGRSVLVGATSIDARKGRESPLHSLRPHERESAPAGRRAKIVRTSRQNTRARVEGTIQPARSFSLLGNDHIASGYLDLEREDVRAFIRPGRREQPAGDTQATDGQVVLPQKGRGAG